MVAEQQQKIKERKDRASPGGGTGARDEDDDGGK